MATAPATITILITTSTPDASAMLPRNDTPTVAADATLAAARQATAGAATAGAAAAATAGAEAADRSATEAAGATENARATEGARAATEAARVTEVARATADTLAAETAETARDTATEAAGATAGAATATQAACEIGSGGGETETTASEPSGPPTIAPRERDEDLGLGEDDAGTADSVADPACGPITPTTTPEAINDAEPIATVEPTATAIEGDGAAPGDQTPAIIVRDGQDDSVTGQVTPSPTVPEVTETLEAISPIDDAAPTVAVDGSDPTPADGLATSAPVAPDPTETAVPIVPDDSDSTRAIGQQTPTIGAGSSDTVVVGESPTADLVLTTTPEAIIDDGQGGAPTEPSTGVVDPTTASALVSLPTGDAQGGPLVLSSDQSRFLVGDGRGGPLWIVNRTGNAIPVQVDGAFYPMWEPGGNRFLITYYPADSSDPAVGMVDATTGAVVRVEVGAMPVPPDDTVDVDGDTARGDAVETETDDGIVVPDGDEASDDPNDGSDADGGDASEATLVQAPVGPVRDVPGGWLAGRPVVQRTYPEDPARGIELWRPGDTVPFWTAVGQEGRTLHPFQAGDRVVLAASGGWVAVSASGAEEDLGPETTGGEITDGVIGPGGVIAYVAQGQLLIARLAAPGLETVIVTDDAARVGFDWAPDGSALVTTSGSTLTVISPSGAIIGSADLTPAGAARAPAWVTDGVLFIDAATGQLWFLPGTSLPS